MKSFFRDLFEYNHYGNQQMISMIEETPSSYSDRAMTLLGHTFNAQHIWNHRILGKLPTQAGWDVFEINELHELNDRNHRVSLEILNTLPLESTINYKNSAGTHYSDSLSNILFHVVNHGTYHRGQLLTELKSNGAKAISTDYIFYKREGS